MKILKPLFTTLTLTTSISTTVTLAQTDCAGPAVDADQNITMSCIAIDGALYRGVLNPVGTDEWKFNLDEYKPSTCSWNPRTCVTVTLVTDKNTRAMDTAKSWEAKLPGLALKGQTATTVFNYVPHSHSDDPNGYYWTFVKQLSAPQASASGTAGTTSSKAVARGSPQGFSDSYGTLAPYTPPTPQDGTGKKLLAVYMVGSDLESGGEAATSDFQELIEGYKALSDPNVDVIVAFGGANKDGWQGMKFANMTQLIEDGQDGLFGNSGDYLYQEDRAHMGDKSSLQLFLSYVREGYSNYQPRMLVFWDHGASYQGFGNDENYNGDALSLEEIDTSLTDSAVGQFELIGFDACLMGSAEVAKVIQNHARYLLGSEELEPGHGWNWTTVMSAYSSGAEVVDTAKQIIDNFVDDKAYPDGQVQDGKTLSVVDLGKFNAVVEAFDVFASSGVTSTSTDALIQASVNSREYGKQSKEEQRYSVDWKHFAQLTKEAVTDEGQQQQLDNFIAALDDYVIYAKEDGTRPDSNGVSFGGLEENAPPLSQAAADFNTAFLGLKQSDTTPPVVVQQDSDANAEEWLTEEEFWEYLEFVSDEEERKGTSRPQRNHIPFLNGERAAFVHFPPSNLRALTTVNGISAAFSDENLARVTTLFGNVLPIPTEDGRETDHLLLVAEVEAYPSDKQPGSYFTPQWNQNWYTVKFAANQMTEWMPMSFQYRYQEDGQTYTYYSAEIDYIRAAQAQLVQIGTDGELVEQGTDAEGYPIYAKDAKGNPVNPIEFATLDILVNDQNVIVAHSIHPYQIMYSGEADDTGYVQFDRMTYKLQPGDVVSFYAEAINLETQESSWLASSGYFTFTQAPEFMVEQLAFETETDIALSYYYTMRAEDIAGNFVLTELDTMANTDTTGATTSEEAGETTATTGEETTTPETGEGEEATGEETTTPEAGGDVEITEDFDEEAEMAKETTEPEAFAGTVAAHNEWRQTVGVPDLIWSASLASVAQEWADDLKGRNCAFEHRPNNQYGENIFGGTGMTLSPKTVVDEWGSEVADYNYDTNTCADGKMCGHYTQLVWSDTTEVGCGTATCDNGSVLWVCNYNPPGNFMGQKPY